MVQRTRRRMAAVFSMIAGFWFTLSGGAAYAGPMTYTSTSAKRVQTTSKDAVAADGHAKSIVPATGMLGAPAPDANKALNIEVMSVKDVQDTSMQNFMYVTAVQQNMNPDQLTSQEFNNLRTDFLLQQVKNLELKLQQLNEQNLSH